MRLKKYLPEFISSIKEFQELDATISTEVDELREKLSQTQNNQFIESANDKGLRRFNILNNYNSTIPFTIAWLRNTLNTTIGRGDFLMALDHSTYTLTISIVKSKEQIIESLKRDLRKRIPANLVLIINVLSAIESETYTGFYLQTGDIITI